MEQTKRCPSCMTVKPFGDFYMNSRTKLGVSSWCKQCTARASRERSKTVKNPVCVVEKRCRKCGETKNAIEFTRRPSSKDGLAPWCRDCTTAAARETRARARSEGKYPVSVKYKRCTKCGETRLAYKFREDASQRDGLDSICRECANESSKRGAQRRRDTSIPTTYTLRFPSGHFYIGSTVCFEQRMSSHKGGVSQSSLNVRCVAEFPDGVPWSKVSVDLESFGTLEKARARERELIEEHIDNPLCLNKSRHT